MADHPLAEVPPEAISFPWIEFWTRWRGLLFALVTPVGVAGGAAVAPADVEIIAAVTGGSGMAFIIGTIDAIVGAIQSQR